MTGYRSKKDMAQDRVNYGDSSNYPPQRPWVGLTDDEYIHITDSVFHTGQGLVAYYKAIEAKLKEKNS
jgi:hypothetical protein